MTKHREVVCNLGLLTTEGNDWTITNNEDTNTEEVIDLFTLARSVGIEEGKNFKIAPKG